MSGAAAVGVEAAGAGAGCGAGSGGGGAVVEEDAAAADGGAEDGGPGGAAAAGAGALPPLVALTTRCRAWGPLPPPPPPPRMSVIRTASSFSTLPARMSWRWEGRGRAWWFREPGATETHPLPHTTHTHSHRLPVWRRPPLIPGRQLGLDVGHAGGGRDTQHKVWGCAAGGVLDGELDGRMDGGGGGRRV